ncbi:6,7-dimethyl-8-ribityllumazine synthase [Gulosibacter molinativorax]|uniref:6,7-dimethyl-8-ribityllumazine synthase n=1 Tax=Gulosibacter molinativorax TaxID=256821 RepID=A0ABT7C8J0_9MICO|nr:6,7-dimethyl-8-ribityllumazine synthase [Gulosibacter molinativorax]MDJ1371482.1 6,7-dimethyl-8-ribityllumazine synthase [Gulosibacter molinativorax]QUY62422.1 6,7-dimethyl-8-ribityllumazine synthase [Gulosibacter molinativorax]
MSKEGSPTIEIDGAGLRVVIVTASWHEKITTALLEGTQRALAEANVTDVEVVRVPGSFELSVAAARIARSEHAPDAIVALGVVIRGGTPHFDFVCTAATDGLNRVALETGIPVGFGLLTCDDEQQALERSGMPGSSEDKGAEAAQAAIATVRALADW